MSEERRRHLEELLKPSGEPLGTPARRGSKVHRVSAGEPEALDLLSKLAAFGQKAQLPTYPGLRIEIPGLGYVGYRAVSKSGEPTIESVLALRDSGT